MRSGKVKTKAFAPLRSMSVRSASAFQARPFAVPSKLAESSFESDDSNLFDTYLQRRAAGFAADFGSAPPQMVIQPKLTLGAVGDRYEQEADQVADEVMRQVNGSVPHSAAQSAKQMTTDYMQRTPDIQSVPTAHGTTVDSGTESAISRARGGEQPLAEHVRAPMEAPSALSAL